MSHEGSLNLAGNVLIVDDTPANLDVLSSMLESSGCVVRPAISGEVALKAVRVHLPDLILLDIMMPGMDGFEVCRRLKADPELRDIPVIFISALDEVFDKVTAFEVGGVDYISKPFQVAEVLSRVQTHLRLREMQQRLQAQNHELEAFSHTVAHDLKNPVSSLVGALSLLREDAVQLSEASRQLLSISIDSVYRMNNIIDELLLLSSIRKEDIVTEPVDMEDVVERALDRLDFMIHEYEAEIMLPDSWLVAAGHAPWIEEVWANYISNGLKYGGQPPILQLGADAASQGMIRFWVKDNGAGLDMEAQSKLFAEFSRLDKVRAQGHGLGLSIVRRIMEKLDGDVGVESAPGEGSLFYFTLPAADQQLDSS